MESKPEGAVNSSPDRDVPATNTASPVAAQPVGSVPSAEPVSAPIPRSAAPSSAPSPASSTGRRPYVPQFSAATQMILSRINNKPGSLSAALSSASSVARSIEQSTFEDAKRRLVMTMKTSLTMPMPTPNQKKPASGTLPAPIGDSFHLRPPPPVPATARTTPAKATPSKSQPSKPRGRPPRGTKRKRGKDDDDDEVTTSPSDLSDSDLEAAKAQTAATMTKSGRQIQKPTQFNPADASGTHKRKNYGKRTAEQALCKVCTRGLSPAMNRIVFCDGCNFCWHQMCHDPYIDDDFVSNESRSWFCGRCMAKREKALAKKKTLEEYKGVSWGSKSGEQRRDYLTNLPHAQLVNIIMYCTEIHPELPIFPSQESGVSSNKRSAQGIYAGSTTASLFPRADPKVRGPTNFAASAASTPDAKSSGEGQDRAHRESSVESIPPAWPKVGKGVLAGLELNEDDFRDENDYEAFSVTTYDSKGRKVMENGMPV